MQSNSSLLSIQKFCNYINEWENKYRKFNTVIKKANNLQKKIL